MRREWKCFLIAPLAMVGIAAVRRPRRRGRAAAVELAAAAAVRLAARSRFWQALGLLALCRILFGGLGWPRRPAAPRIAPPHGRSAGSA